MISKVLKNRLSEKDQLKKELEKKILCSGNQTGGWGIQYTAKKKKKLLMKQRARLHAQMGFGGPTLRVHTQG